MKKLLHSLSAILTAFIILYSCSTEEEITTPKQYILTITSSVGGTVSSEGGIYNEGTEVTISATPNEGYRFIGWEGDSSEDEDTGLTFIVNSDLNFKALFEINTQYDLTLTISDSGGGSVYVEGGENYVGFIRGTYFEGTEVSIIATPSDGYVFNEWSNDSTDNPYEIIITEDLSLEASFSEINSLSGK